MKFAIYIGKKELENDARILALLDGLSENGATFYVLSGCVLVILCIEVKRT